MAASAIIYGSLRTASGEASALIRGELKLLCGAREELVSLRDSLSLIQAFLCDAEKRQYQQSAVNLWLRNLKDVAFDAQDVIDEAATDARWPPPIPIFSNYLMARKIKGIRERLERIQREAATLGLQQMLIWPSELLDLAPAQRPTRETGSAVTESSIVGRAEDLEKLIRLLSPPPPPPDSQFAGERFSVVSIVGMGGIGKTALAWHVYNDDRVKSRFGAKAWVLVSPKFDVVKLISEILECITKERPNLTTLETLQTQLGSVLRGKSFLLVLDDVWNLDQWRWEELCVPLLQANLGSKVLITTRNQLGDANAVVSIDLGLLSDTNCWSILKRSAFAGGRADDHPRLEMLGRQIAVKAKGVPLAAKALGGLLKSFGLDENRWRGILEADVSQLREDNGIMPVLRLSYQHLPPHLKQCFAYCAVFPKGSSINKDRLVSMWMALGFIQTQGYERMEDVGSDYFNALCARSFFQYVEYRYSMHDLMHDLSQSVSEDECFVIESEDLGKVPEDVRHLTLRTIELEMLEKLHKFRKLRSLLFFCKYKPSFTPVLEKLFKQLKSLRVLDLDCDRINRACDSFGFCCFLSLCRALCWEEPPCLPCDEDELPTSIGSLKHLRYLHLNFYDIHALPESLGTLYNLQTLIIGECLSLHRLPKNLSNLIKLRQLEANSGLLSNIEGIGKLTSLQKLQKFSIGKGKGHKVGELSDLNQIRGRLSISNLENVISREESMVAKLDSKCYIDTLEFEWSEDREASSITCEHDEQVLEGLKPHANLKELFIKNYGGARSSGWMLNQLPPFLETVCLFKCTKLENFPPLGQLRFLKVLEARRMDAVAQLTDFKGFPSLEKLVFDDMPRWEELSVAEEGQAFPSLRNLVIHNCPKLRGLPPLPLSLSKLELAGVGLHCLPEIWGCPSKTEISSKRTLLSSNMVAAATTAPSPPPQASRLPATAETASPSSSAFSVSEIFECLKMETLFEDLIMGLLWPKETASPLSSSLSVSETSESFDIGSSIRYLMLKVMGLNALKVAMDVMQSPPSSSSLCSSLSTMEISNCPNLSSLHEGLLRQDLGALRILRISDCEGLVDLPEHGLPSRIELLVIKRCPLLKERCIVKGGPDWPKIAHIPYIQIDGVWINGAELGKAINEDYGTLKRRLEEFIVGLFWH